MLLQQWEFLIRNIVDFGNGRRFSLRCLGGSITPARVKLKKTVRTSESFCIIRKGRKTLLK